MKPARAPNTRRSSFIRYAIMLVPAVLIVTFLSRAESASFKASVQQATKQVAQASQQVAADASDAIDDLIDQAEEWDGPDTVGAQHMLTRPEPANQAAMLEEEEEEQADQQQQQEEEGDDSDADYEAALDEEEEGGGNDEQKRDAKEEGDEAAAKHWESEERARNPKQQESSNWLGVPGWTYRPKQDTFFASKEVNLSRDFGTKQSDDKQEVLQELGQCKTLRCLIGAHDKLAGRTPFNIPHFFLVGWQKCATTSAITYLKKHPQVLSSPIKESHFFSACGKRRPGGGPSKNCHAHNQTHYIQDTLQIEAAAAAGLQQATYDASADYAWKGEALALRLYRLFPWLRIVIMMREPIARAISYTRMHTQQAHAFKGCRGKGSLYECIEPVLVAGERKFNYSGPLEGWLATFPREQVHIIQYEELLENPLAVLTALKVFLGLDPLLPKTKLKDVNNRAAAAGGEPMRREQYRLLVKHARQDAQRAAALMAQYGVADGEAFLRRWEAKWESVVESKCDAEGRCLINSH